MKEAIPQLKKLEWKVILNVDLVSLFPFIMYKPPVCRNFMTFIFKCQ